jgi:DNA invertase Pin-like site-specific DNA recombinase
MGSKQAVAYYRISQDTAGDMLGVERQQATVRELAERNGYKIVQEFTDNDVSAYSRKPRPGYQAMLSFLANNPNTTILAYGSDRLYRRNTDLEQIVDDLGGCHIVTAASGNVDLTTADGRMVARMLGAAAQREVEKLAERVAARARQRAVSGVSTTGRRPFGWQWADGGGLEPHPLEAPALAAAYEWVLEGVNLSEIARRLNDQGFTGSRGGALTQARVSTFLRHPRNGGLVKYQGQLIDADNAEGCIVEPATWRKVQRILSDPSRSPRRKGGGRPATTWLAGMLTCYKCGTGVRAASNQRRAGDRYLTYDCPKHHVSWRRDSLEAVIEGQVLDYLSANIDALRAADARRNRTLAADNPALAADLDRLRADRDGLAEALGVGALTVASYTTAVAVVEARIEQVQSQLDGPLPAPSPLTDVLVADDIEAMWRAASVDTRRQILSALAETVTVEPARSKSARIEWRTA